APPGLVLGRPGYQSRVQIFPAAAGEMASPTGCYLIQNSWNMPRSVVRCAVFSTVDVVRVVGCCAVSRYPQKNPGYGGYACSGFSAWTAVSPTEIFFSPCAAK